MGNFHADRCPVILALRLTLLRGGPLPGRPACRSGRRRAHLFEEYESARYERRLVTFTMHPEAIGRGYLVRMLGRLLTRHAGARKAVVRHARPDHRAGGEPARARLRRLLIFAALGIVLARYDNDFMTGCQMDAKMVCG